MLINMADGSVALMGKEHKFTTSVSLQRLVFNYNLYDNFWIHFW